MEIRFCFRDTPKWNSVSVSATLRNGIPFLFPRHSETEFRFRFRITLLYKPQQYVIICKRVWPKLKLSVCSLVRPDVYIDFFPWSVASICPTSKSDNLCKQTKREPPFDGMRCAIVALITFLVVAAFNPERFLLNFSLKLGSNVALLHSSEFSSSSLSILFITARPMHNCFSLSSSCVDLLVYSVL